MFLSLVEGCSENLSLVCCNPDEKANELGLRLLEFSIQLKRTADGVLCPVPGAGLSQ